MFEFRIINLADGSQVIDETLKTPYNNLTAVQMAEYIEVDNSLMYMERMKREHNKQTKKHGLLFKLSCLCGTILHII